MTIQKGKQTKQNRNRLYLVTQFMHKYTRYESRFYIHKLNK